MKNRQTKPISAGRKGTAPNRTRPRTPASNPKRSRSGASADPRKSYERYVALARAAAVSGDAIEAENWHQHAEHYFRLMNQKAA